MKHDFIKAKDKFKSLLDKTNISEDLREKLLDSFKEELVDIFNNQLNELPDNPEFYSSLMAHVLTDDYGNEFVMNLMYNKKKEYFMTPEFHRKSIISLIAEGSITTYLEKLKNYKIKPVKLSYNESHDLVNIALYHDEDCDDLDVNIRVLSDAIKEGIMSRKSLVKANYCSLLINRLITIDNEKLCDDFYETVFEPLKNYNFDFLNKEMRAVYSEGKTSLAKIERVINGMKKAGINVALDFSVKF